MTTSNLSWKRSWPLTSFLNLSFSPNTDLGHEDGLPVARFIGLNHDLPSPAATGSLEHRGGFLTGRLTARFAAQHARQLL